MMVLQLLKKFNIFGLLLLIIPAGAAFSQSLVLESHMNHLRTGNHPEWNSFTEPHENELKISFDYTNIEGDKTLSLEQEDVKQNWLFRLNGKELGKLVTDENAMIVYWALPPGILKNGKNTLSVVPADTIADDILAGNIVLFDRPLKEVLSQGKVEITVTDGQTKSLLPSRITIVNKDGALQPVGADPDLGLAIRAGCIYTGTGKVSFGLPAGDYTIYANHGFEYSVDSARITVKAGSSLRKELVISREVPTEGWISADTHIHTNYYSGDGDASLQERVLTIAGEGLELPILTDHNVKSNLDSMAKALMMRKYFTPVVGYEYTTDLGHFNVFPVPINTPVPDYHINNWNEVVDNLHRTDHPKIIILNHARDTHKDFRPFDPKFHISCAGTDLRNWKFPANAMEVINSSASLTDYMSLYEDWFGMLNRGYLLTPVGGSDSHTVYRYLVGQGRTYIKSKAVNPGNIDINEAVENFKDGKVMVSFGLLTEMVVDSNYGPGDIVPASSGMLSVSVRVLGPGWTKADHIVLYANGKKIKEEVIPNGGKPGIKYNKTWKIPRPKQDIFLVAIAEGPGGKKPFWPVPKPYQNTSPIWTPRVIGSTGVIWIDGDGDGKKTSANTYAHKIINNSGGDIHKLLIDLSEYDEAVTVQTATILHEQGKLLTTPEFAESLKQTSSAVQRSFRRYNDALQETVVSKNMK